MPNTNDTDYLTELGRAIFSFAVLEYRVMYILEKLSPGTSTRIGISRQRERHRAGSQEGNKERRGHDVSDTDGASALRVLQIDKAKE